MKRPFTVILLAFFIALLVLPASTQAQPDRASKAQGAAGVGITPISYGQTLTGGLSVQNDIDTLSFEGAIGERVFVMLTGLHSQTDPDVELINPSGGSMGRVGTSTEAILIRTLTEDGTHLILAREWNGDPGNYGVFLQRLTDPVGAVPITYGQTLAGSFSPGGDADTYTFDGLDGDEIFAMNTVLTQQMDPIIDLFDSQGNYLATHTHHQEAIIRDSLTADETYILIVRESNAGNTGGYGVHLQRLNGPVGATPIAYGQTIAGSFSPGGDADAFTFNGLDGERIFAMNTALTQQMDPIIDLYDSQGNLLASHISATEAILRYTLTSDETYLLIVRESHRGDTGGYGIHLQRLNDPVGATSIAYSQTLTGSLSPGGDADAFTFNGLDGEEIFAMNTAVPTQMDPILDLYDAQGNLLNSQTSATEAIIRDSLTADETYLLLVRESHRGETGAYGLTLHRLTNPVSPIAIAYGQTLVGTLSPSGDADLYSFSGLSGDQVRIRVSVSNDLGPTVELYDAEGNRLAVHHAYDVAQIVHTLPATESFSIVVFEVNGGDTGNFTISLELLASLGVQLLVDATLDQGGTVYSDSSNAAGLHPDATDGYDAAFDLPETPAPPDNFVQLFFTNPDLNGSGFTEFSADVRALADLANEAREWSFDVETGGSQVGETVTLGFRYDQVPAAYPILLVDHSDGSIHDVRALSGGEYAFTAAVVPRTFTVRIGTGLPVVTIIDPVSPLVGTSHTLDWTVDEHSAITGFTVEFSADSGATYQAPIDIMDGTARSYMFTTPADSFFYQYRARVTAEDFLSNTGQDESSVFMIVQDSLRRVFPVGWVLLGFPLHPDDPSLDGIFGTGDSNPYFVFGFDGGYFMPDTMEVGPGYWLGVTTAPRTVDLTGTAVTSTFDTPLLDAWTMVGNPLGATFVKEAFYLSDGVEEKTFAEAVAAGWIVNSIYGYDGGYTEAFTVEPWKGYWIRVLQPGLSLRLKPAEIPVFGAPRFVAKRVPSTSSWTLTIQASGDEAEDLITTLGVHPEATNHFDNRFDAPEPPAPPRPPSVQSYFVHPEWGLETDYRFNRDIQAELTPDEARTWPLDVQAVGLSGQEVTLTWQAPHVEDLRFALIDTETGATIDMEEQTTYRYTVDETGLRSFDVRVAPAATDVSLEKTPIPRAYRLDQNYPNPFNSTTTITFSLREPGHTSLTVYNLLGQAVASLVDEHRSAGTHRVVFDATGLPSGHYFYRLASGDFVRQKMLMLMK